MGSIVCLRTQSHRVEALAGTVRNSHFRTLCREVFATATAGPSTPLPRIMSLVYQLVAWSEFRSVLHFHRFLARLACQRRSKNRPRGGVKVCRLGSVRSLSPKSTGGPRARCAVLPT